MRSRKRSTEFTNYRMHSPTRIPQRVLMTADTVGGVWTYAMELIRGYALYDISVTLATMGAEPTHCQAMEAARLANLELVSSRYKLEWMDDPWGDVSEAGEWLLD